MRISGKTPLVRAQKLEEELGVKKIYLKLEGSNPTHHKYARIAEIICSDTLVHNKRTILVDGTNSYIRAVEYFAIKNDLDIIIPRFKRETWKTRRFKESSILDLRNQTFKSNIDYLKSLANKNNYYLAVEGYTNKEISVMALEEMTTEILNKKQRIDSIYTQFGYGYTISSIYNVFLKEWILNESPFPRIYCGVASDNQLKTDDIGHDILSYIHADKSLLESTRQALKESYGKAIVIDEEELKHARKLLRDKEHIKVSIENAYPLAAFIKQAKAGLVREGKHVIVLDDARTRIEITQIDDFSEENKTLILHHAKTYLAEYSDPVIEMKDAIENASKKGYVFMARQNDQNLGICIIVNTQFDQFIPTYHLAYIGTNKNFNGRGIATELIKRAIDVTQGKLSLHVDLDNKNAKKLYEKMGFLHKYNRMIYYGD